MNFILLGYIIAWIAVIWAIAVLYEYGKLTPMQQAQITSIKAGNNIIALIISIVYIIVYHIS